jgi:hypothetical protein
MSAIWSCSDMTLSVPRSVPDILTAAAREAFDLHRMADELQCTIAALSTDLGPGRRRVRPEVLTGCQAADVLSQRLAGLVLYLNCLAIAAPQDALMDTTAAEGVLPMADQAALLGGRARIVEAEPSGELELFDV